jgi:signal transduction histidine kinase
MARAVPRVNPQQRQKTLDNLEKHHEAEGGKVALMQTWDDMREGKLENPHGINIPEEHQYLVELGKRIRQERVYISHIRP